MSGAPAGKPGDAELPDLISHVNFEIEILAVAFDRLAQLGEGSTYEDRLNASVYANAMLVALRGVTWFFSGNRGSHGNGVIAKDFARGWSKKHGSPDLRVLEDAVGPISQRVAHITTARERDRKSISSYPDLTNAIDAVLGKFTDELGEPWRGRFHTSLAVARQHVRSALPDGGPG